MSGTSVNLGYPLWVDGMTFNSVLGRTIGTSMFYTQAGSNVAPIPGVINNHRSAFVTTALGGMNISVGVGDAIISNATSSLNGPYLVNLASSASLTVPTADPSNPRIDLIVADVYDVGTSASYCAIELITGTPAPSPSVPTPAAGVAYIPLAQIAVAAGTTSITSGNITDVRVYNAAAGGAILYPRGVSAAVGNGGHAGRIGYDQQNDRFFHDNGNSGSIPAAQIRLKPWATAIGYNAGPTSISTTATTLTSVTINTDGVTDIDIQADVYGVTGPSGSGDANTYLFFTLDSTQLARHYLGNLADSEIRGANFHWRTGSVTGDTPSSGSHTVFISALCALSGSVSTGYVKLIVSPVSL